MNQHDHQTPDRDELRDRLLDAALRERLGGDTPPDLSEAILQRASADPAIHSSTTKEATMAIDSSHNRRQGWNVFAIAAMVLVAAGLLIFASAVDGLRAARRTTRSTEASKQSPSAAPANHVFSSEATEDQKFLDTRGAMPDSISQKLRKEELAAAKGTSSVPNYTVDLDTPFRQGSFELGTPQFTESNRDKASGDSNYQIESPLIQGAGVEQGPAATEKNVILEQSSGQSHNYGYEARARQETTGLAASSPTRFGLANEAGGGQASSAGNQQGSSTEPALHAWHDLASSRSEDRLKTSNDDDARRIASLTEQLVAVDGEIHSRLSASRSVNRAVIRDIMSRKRALVEQIQRLKEQARAPMGRDQYARITDNPFLPVSPANTDHRLSTFSIDVDTASYANVRQFLTRSGMLPPPDAVRIEELVNYFDYAYTPPTGDVPFAAHVEVSGCPWAPEHRLVRIGIKGREIARTQRPLSNLVFLIDVSGSMNEPNKLPLLVAGMKQLTRELGENDRVAIVVYASSEGLALESTPGTDQSKIIAALDQLRAGGSTAGGAGIQLAYQVAQQNFIKGAVNRVILCTDGDFNVGVTSPAELERLAETNAKETGVFLTVLGFGRGNLNDAMMEQIADKGNGNYHYIDTDREARKVLVEEMTGTLVTIAKDVKIQVEFNPAHVAGYRLIGYENRVLAAEDFNDDKKDAGEIGAGHTVTALYEIVPAGQQVAAGAVDELKYGSRGAKTANEESAEKQENDSDEASAAAGKEDEAPASEELLTLKIRYKAPDGEVSSKLEFPIVDDGAAFGAASDDFKFAAAAAGFGMLLRDSQYKGNATYAAMAEIAEAASGEYDPHGYRREFVELVKRARELAGE